MKKLSIKKPTAKPTAKAAAKKTVTATQKTAAKKTATSTVTAKKTATLAPVKKATTAKRANPFTYKGVRRETFEVLLGKRDMTFSDIVSQVRMKTRAKSKKAIAHRVRLVLSPAYERKYNYRLVRRPLPENKLVYRYSLVR